MTAVILYGMLALQTIVISGCTKQKEEVAVMMEGLNSSLKSLEQQSIDASVSAQASEAASVQMSQADASSQAASVQASQVESQVVEAASIQVSQAESQAASVQASQAESQAAEVASIQASQAESQAIEAASIQASQAESQAASIRASEVEAEAQAAAIQASEAEAAAQAAAIRASEAASRAASIRTSEATPVQATDAGASAQEVSVQPPEGHNGPWVGGRKVYLTFDDGPSYLTPQVLDILDRYQVKATFFVTYTENPELVPCYNEIVKRGHTIAIHTASHEYNQIYSSMEAFIADFDKIYNYVRDLTGVSCQFYRFPGGSSTNLNLAIRDQIKAWLDQRGIIYHDWNVVTGDGGTVTTEEAYHNVVDNIVPRSHPVVLLHDGERKETTVEALPKIIETLKSWGFTFAPLDTTVEPIRQGINW